MDEFLKELADLLEKHDAAIRAVWCNTSEAVIEVCVGPDESIEFDYDRIDVDGIRNKQYT